MATKNASQPEKRVEKTCPTCNQAVSLFDPTQVNWGGSVYHQDCYRGGKNELRPVGNQMPLR